MSRRFLVKLATVAAILAVCGLSWIRTPRGTLANIVDPAGTWGGEQFDNEYGFNIAYCPDGMAVALNQTQLSSDGAGHSFSVYLTGASPAFIGTSQPPIQLLGGDGSSSAGSVTKVYLYDPSNHPNVGDSASIVLQRWDHNVAFVAGASVPSEDAVPDTNAPAGGDTASSSDDAPASNLGGDTDGVHDSGGKASTDESSFDDVLNASSDPGIGAPVANCTVLPTTSAPVSGTLGNNNYYKAPGPVAVNLSASETDLQPPTFNVSIASITYTATTANPDGSTTTVTNTVSGASTSIPLSDGTTTLAFHATDSFGNSEVAKTTTVKVDTTPPVVSVPQDITTDATSTSGASVPFTVSATDNIAGTLTPACTINNGAITVTSGYTFPLGKTPVSCTATDEAGNATTKTFNVNVAYGWSGVLQPVNPDSSSIFKQGSTVPIKFQLTGPSAGITNAAITIQVAKVSNGVLGTSVEAISTSAADSGNTFRYDAGSGQYIFNLSTKPLTTGTYQLQISPVNTNEHALVNISLR